MDAPKISSSNEATGNVSLAKESLQINEPWEDVSDPSSAATT